MSARYRLGAALLAAALAAMPAARAEQAGCAAAPAEGRRVVSVGGAVTEIVAALGALCRVVAVDTTSEFPAAVRALPKVGYMRTLSAEGVVSTRPDLVLAVEQAGPPAVLSQLAAAGIAVHKVPESLDPDAVPDRIRNVAGALGLEAEGETLARAVADDLARLKAMVGTLPGRPRVLFLLSASSGAPLAAGRQTAADTMIALAGGRNAIDGFTGYKALTPEAAVMASPDIVLMMREAVALAGGEAAILSLPQVAVTPAGKSRRLVTMGGVYLLGLGPRTAHAARDLAAALHPERDLPALPARPWVSGGGGS